MKALLLRLMLQKALAIFLVEQKGEKQSQWGSHRAADVRLLCHFATCQAWLEQKTCVPENFCTVRPIQVSFKTKPRCCRFSSFRCSRFVLSLPRSGIRLLFAVSVVPQWKCFVLSESNILSVCPPLKSFSLDKPQMGSGFWTIKVVLSCCTCC